MKPDLLQVVTQPMDLTTVKTRLDNSFYADLATCVGDLQQVWTNAKLYNPGHHTIHKWAEELNMITGTGDVLQDHFTVRFPILELSASAKRLSVMSMLTGSAVGCEDRIAIAAGCKIC